MGLTKMESRYDPNSKEEILKTIEDIFEREKSDPDPKIRKQAAREIKMLKGQASGIIDSLSCLSLKIPEPKVPEGYRLPTKSEYLFFESIEKERQELRALATLAKGKEKKELFHKCSELVGKMIEMAEAKKIYYIGGSNRYIGSKDYL